MVYLFQFFLSGAVFLMQDVSSVYDLFDPKLREISATHHFMTRTTHIVCFKDKKEIGLSKKFLDSSGDEGSRAFF